MESKKAGSDKNRVEWWLPGQRGGGIGEMMFQGTNWVPADK